MNRREFLQSIWVVWLASASAYTISNFTVGSSKWTTTGEKIVPGVSMGERLFARAENLEFGVEPSDYSSERYSTWFWPPMPTNAQPQSLARRPGSSRYEWPPAVARAVEATKNRIFVTVDDGPGRFTESFASALEAVGMRWTFFFIGEQMTDRYKPVMRRVVERGHLIGNHSYSHPNFRKISLAKAKDEVSRTDDRIRDVIASTGGKTSQILLFRYPFGAPVRPEHNAEFMSFLRSKNYRQDHVHWDIDTKDWAARGKRLAQALGDVRSSGEGKILLMHEKETSLDWLKDSLLPRLRAMRLLSVPFSGK